MGRSYAVRAGWVIDSWTKACLAQTKIQNTFKVDGDTFFFEYSRNEHADGAITGSIWKFVGENTCRRSGQFRIESDGTVTRAPRFLKNASPTKEELESQYQETFHRPTPEERIRRNHEAFAADRR